MTVTDGTRSSLRYSRAATPSDYADAAAATWQRPGRRLDDRVALKETAWTPTGTLEVRGTTARNLRVVEVRILLDVRAARAATGTSIRRR